jgi:hypothetical protein
MPGAESGPLHGEQRRLRVEPCQVVRVAGDDKLPSPVRADDDVRVDDVGGAGRGEQPADVRGIHPVERDNIGGRRPGQPNQPDLPFGPASTLSAHARSSSDSGPPVAVSASASAAPQLATSSRATPTACWTKPDTIAAAPRSTRSRIRASWPSSRVTVTLRVAIPITIWGVGLARARVRVRLARGTWALMR